MDEIFRTDFQFNNFLSLRDLSRDNIISLINTALRYRHVQLKLNSQKQKLISSPFSEHHSTTLIPPKRHLTNLLAGRSIALLFESPSTRTRSSLQLAIHELGGHALYLDAHQSQLSRNESLLDTIRTLERYCSSFFIRSTHHSKLTDLALANQSNNSSHCVPIINALSDAYHPCEALAAFVTLAALRGGVENFKNLKIGYLGDGSNVAASLALGCEKLGINLTLASPPKHGLCDEIQKELAGSRCIRFTQDPKEASHQADVLYTDTFVSIGKNVDAAQREKLKQEFKPYQVSAELASLAKKDYLFFHCLPAYRGEEVSADIIDGPRSAVFEICESRVYTYKALLSSIF